MQRSWDGNFPQDIVNEILLRLPVKSLLRFKCVCKHWYAVIKSPGFVSKHFNHEHNQTRLLLCYETDNYRQAISLLPDETLAGMPPLHHVIDHSQCPQVVQHLVGPVDGLFFLHERGYGSDDRMTLWNPATREFRPLPMPPPTMPPHLYAEQTFGFGLDPSTGSLKVIWIRFLLDDRTENVFPYFVVAVYTLGSDTWRYLDPLPDTRRFIRNSLSATCVNGAYYWLDSSHLDKHCILSFDMSCEVFRDVEGPDHTAGTCASLTLCCDSIALFLCKPVVVSQCVLLSTIDLWVMKEEGCWDKLVRVKPLIEVSRPLGFWKNEEVLLESTSSELFLYNHDTREIRHLGTYGRGPMVYSYKESLLSVNGQKEDPKGYNVSDMVGHDIASFVPAAREKVLVDKTTELVELVECFSREQDFYHRQHEFNDEMSTIDGLPKEVLLEAWPILYGDPTKLETFFTLEGAERNLYVEKVVRGG